MKAPSDFSILPVILFGIILCFSCNTYRGSSGNSLKPLSFKIEQSDEWTKLFERSEGWFGGDGIFSIPLNGRDFEPEKEVLLIFSDSFFGTVKDGKPQSGDTMINNSLALFEGKNNLRFISKEDSRGRPKSIFTPIGSEKSEEFFWLGDGFINRDLNNRLYLFAYHIQRTGPNVFDFSENGVSLLSIEGREKLPFEKYRQIPTPLSIESTSLGSGNFGSGILVNTKWAGAPFPDGYIYVYGCIGEAKNLVCARVKPKNFEDFSTWTYWDGVHWSKDKRDLVSLANAVSNELSVTALENGTYLLVFQVLGLSDKVGIRTGPSPVGPFSDIQEIYRTPEIENGLLPYNAKAHPALSKPGELLISYNTITLDFWNDIKKDASIYHPRFIRMVFQ